MKLKTTTIAEVGINANADLDIAKQIIDMAKAAGCTYVKFQKRDPDVSTPEHQKSVPKDTPWGSMTYLEYKHKMEFSREQYNEIDRYCKEKQIGWTASVWDLPSLEFMKQYNVPFIKIPSAHLTNEPLVQASAEFCRDRKIPIVISTGMSTIEEIDKAYELVIKTKAKLVLMHCCSAYPAPIEDLNLRCITTFQERYYDAYAIGYSSHEKLIGTTVAACVLGATWIERHVTLDRTMWGSDQFCSVEKLGLNKLISGISDWERARGDGIKRVTAEELKMKKKMRPQ